MVLPWLLWWCRWGHGNSCPPAALLLGMSGWGPPAAQSSTGQIATSLPVQIVEVIEAPVRDNRLHELLQAREGRGLGAPSAAAA